MYQHSSHWTDFREIWYWRLSRKSRKIPSLAKVGQNIVHFTWRPSMFYCCPRHKFAIKAFLYNTKYFCIVICDTDQQYTTRCCVYIATMVARIRHSVTSLHVLCLSWYDGQKWMIRNVMYRVAHEKPARRLVDQRGRMSRTLYRKLNKCKVLTG